jgi:hypothetical protein
MMLRLENDEVLVLNELLKRRLNDVREETYHMVEASSRGQLEREEGVLRGLIRKLEPPPEERLR